jgi:hypothetical protein
MDNFLSFHRPFFSFFAFRVELIAYIDLFFKVTGICVSDCYCYCMQQVFSDMIYKKRWCRHFKEEFTSKKSLWIMNLVSHHMLIFLILQENWRTEYVYQRTEMFAMVNWRGADAYDCAKADPVEKQKNKKC